MPLKLKNVVIYLITSGETTAATTPASKDFSRVLRLVEAAVAAGVNLVQLREKNLQARVLYELSVRAAQIARHSGTSLLVNDRADIAFSAGVHGVHLASTSLETAVVRETFGQDFLIGVSTHSVADVRAARAGGASFAVFGPVFETASKRTYGEPVGLRSLREAVTAVSPFPVLALGGIALENVGDCLRAGAVGVGAIRLLQDPDRLGPAVARIRETIREVEKDGGGY